MFADGLHALAAAAQLMKQQRAAAPKKTAKKTPRRTSVRITNLKLKLGKRTQTRKTQTHTRKTITAKKTDPLLGRKLRKQFFSPSGALQWYDGEVASVSRAAKAGFFYRFGKVTSTVKYFVKYPRDNDSEHMTKAQLKQHLVK
jgi:hypothetical protein